MNISYSFYYIKANLSIVKSFKRALLCIMIKNYFGGLGKNFDYIAGANNLVVGTAPCACAGCPVKTNGLMLRI